MCKRYVVWVGCVHSTTTVPKNLLRTLDRFLFQWRPFIMDLKGVRNLPAITRLHCIQTNAKRKENSREKPDKLDTIVPTVIILIFPNAKTPPLAKEKCFQHF